MEQLSLMCLALLKLFSVWFFVTALLFWKRPQRYPAAAPRMRFAVLIAARNEEAVVGALVASLHAQDYPAALYDVYVIPNNCTDGTEDAARAAGARIFRCFEPVTCKGDALHEAVAWLLPRGYDAFCVFDADNVADRQFLARMNDALCAGARVAKGRLHVKNPYDSALAGCYELYFTLCDRFFSTSRANLGLSAKLVGTGFAVHRDVLERLGGWNTATIAEDAEFAAQCALLGERVWWVPEAVSYDEAPNSFRVSLRQRRRWCSGIMSAAERMAPALLHCAPRAAWPRTLDMALFLCAPFAQALSVVPALLTAFSAAAQGELAFRLAAAGAAFCLAAAGMLLCGALLVLLSPCRDRRILKSAALFPVFMAVWLPLQVVSLLRRTTRWQEIRHSRALDVSTLPQPRRAA